MRTRRFLLFASLFALDAMACDCATLSVQQRERESQAVFVGRVLAHEPLQTVELRVLEIFKGSVARQLTIPTGIGDCDFFIMPIQPRPGDEFLVFLTRKAGKLSVSRCLGSAPVAAASQDLAYFRTRRTTK
jgi:hypothetical protein